jgi:hypothetical protein
MVAVRSSSIRSEVTKPQEKIRPLTWIWNTYLTNNVPVWILSATFKLRQENRPCSKKDELRHTCRRQPKCLTDQYADVPLKYVNICETNCTWNAPRKAIRSNEWQTLCVCVGYRNRGSGNSTKHWKCIYLRRLLLWVQITEPYKRHHSGTTNE